MIEIVIGILLIVTSAISLVLAWFKSVTTHSSVNGFFKIDYYKEFWIGIVLIILGVITLTTGVM